MKKMAWALLMLSALWVAVPVSAQDSYGGSDGLVIESDDGGAVPGSTVRIVQTGFDPDTEVLIRIVDNNGNVINGVEVLGAIAVRADAQGTVDVELRLPEGTAAGVYDILLSGTAAGKPPRASGRSKCSRQRTRRSPLMPAPRQTPLARLTQRWHLPVRSLVSGLSAVFSWSHSDWGW